MPIVWWDKSSLCAAIFPYFICYRTSQINLPCFFSFESPKCCLDWMELYIRDIRSEDVITRDSVATSCGSVLVVGSASNNAPRTLWSTNLSMYVAMSFAVSSANVRHWDWINRSPRVCNLNLVNVRLVRVSRVGGIHGLSANGMWGV